MSKVNVNTIEPSTGTDITLGASGDTITVPSGATFTQSGTMNASAITAGTLAIAQGGTGAATFLAAELANTPAFLVYASSNTSCSNATNTTIAYNTETLDNGGCFNNTSGTVTLNGVSVPAYSFGPNVAGYYWVSALGYFSSGTDYDSNRIFIEKNTTTSFASINGRNLYYNGLFAGNVVHLNGSSDTIRVRVIQGSGGSLDFDSNVTIGGFSGFKLIGA